MTSLHDAAIATLAARLEEFEGAAASDATANPILRLAMDLGDRLTSGDLTYGALEQVIQQLTLDAFNGRAQRLAAYMGETDMAANIARLTKAITAVATADDGTPRSFAEFQGAVESELFGIVITAHPTFCISESLMRLLNRLASEAMPESERNALLQQASEMIHKPDDDLSLDREQAMSLEAIANIRSALHRMFRVVLDVAERLYPDEWRRLTPRLITVASWVGYDLDGRSDISFADMLAKRLITQARQLSLLEAEFAGLRADLALDGEALQIIELIETRLELGSREVAEEIAVFGDFHAEQQASREAVAKLSRHLNATTGRRLMTAEQLIPLLDKAIALLPADPAKQLIVLRAELTGNGIALARTHVRINATQLHNSIRKAVSLETAPDDPRYRQSYVTAISDLIANVQPARINFGTLLAERTSAKRLFMTVVQMLKYMDGAVPVRFLIAECESAFTPLVALYYAKLFGIADRLEICPLFETEKALQLGSRVIEQLVDNQHFRAYLQVHKRLCIQTGYSDAGRFIGQPPAAGSIERLKERVVRLLDRHHLHDIELVFFDTHGESVGRGGHPGGFAQRLDYIHAPHIAEMIVQQGIRYKQESSFQGGDGYLYFLNQAGALATVTSILEWRLKRTSHNTDPYYQQRDTVTEFLTTVKEFQSGLIADPNYAVLLGTFGGNLLYRTGSRATKRMDASETSSRPQISQFRAIPHNAILQQLGMLTNTLGGVGAAIEHDPGHFQTLYARSQRFRSLMGMIEYAYSVSNPNALKAYVDTLDPGLWLLRAAACQDGQRVQAFRRIADALEDWGVQAEQVKIFRHLFEDFTLLREGLQRVDVMPAATDKTLSLLHALRLAIMHELYFLGTQVPEFSSRQDIANRRLFLQILQLNIPTAVDTLKKIFPAHGFDADSGDFGEPADYIGDDKQSYERETATLFEPMLTLYGLMLRISTAVAHCIGFIG